MAGESANAPGAGSACRRAAALRRRPRLVVEAVEVAGGVGADHAVAEVAADRLAVALVRVAVPAAAAGHLAVDGPARHAADQVLQVGTVNAAVGVGEVDLVDRD